METPRLEWHCRRESSTFVGRRRPQIFVPHRSCWPWWRVRWWVSSAALARVELKQRSSDDLLVRRQKSADDQMHVHAAPCTTQRPDVDHSRPIGWITSCTCTTDATATRKHATRRARHKAAIAFSHWSISMDCARTVCPRGVHFAVAAILLFAFHAADKIHAEHGQYALRHGRREGGERRWRARAGLFFGRGAEPTKTGPGAAAPRVRRAASDLPQ